MMKNLKYAILALEDGTIFHGQSICHEGWKCGEIVFNTAMSGFQEICSDPSYCDQIVVLTCPHVGNVGCNEYDYESNNIWLSGLIVREMSRQTSNWRAENSFISFLKKHNLLWMDNIDTRKLTHIIRNHGSQNGCILVSSQLPNNANTVRLAKKYISFKNSTFVKKVSTKVSFKSSHRKDSYRICVLDCGVKNSILHHLSNLNCSIMVVPAYMHTKTILSFDPDGIVLSNGPGDPATLVSVIKNIQDLLKASIPIMGICLGCQLLALASGARIKKMKYGHHGVNHPIYDLQNKQIFITSQNHNFMIDEQALPSNITITHRSLFDNTIQGIKLNNLPAFGLQGHPEANPGPFDMQFIFKQFFNMIHLSKITNTVLQNA